MLALAACESVPPLGLELAAPPTDLVRFDVVFGGADIYDDLGNTDPVVDGAKLVASGVGLNGATSGTISVTVPGGATIRSAHLYWGSRDDIDDDGDGELTVTVGATTDLVAGAYIGATTIDPGNDSHSFRADLIVEGFSFLPGLNEVDLVVEAGQGVDGASLVITYDDGTSGSVVFRDGNDFAYLPRGMQTEEQTFTFPSSPADRTATLLLVVGDVQDSRPNRIVITSGGTGDLDLINDLGDGGPGRDGPEWDTYPVSVLVPAGSTELSAQLLSHDDLSDLEPASLYWVLGALELQDPPPPSVCDGLTPGYWKNWENHYTSAQFQQLVDWVNDNDYAAVDLTIEEITAILGYGGPNVVQRLKKFYYANLLTLALTDHAGLPNPDSAGLDPDCASPRFPGTTLGEALAAAEAIFANPTDFTTAQINAVKNVLDAIANLND